VLLPMTFSRINRRGVFVSSILASQFANVPTTKSDTQITLLEEEKNHRVLRCRHALRHARTSGAVVLNVNPHHEHEFEAAPGLPEPLPASERLLWQGAPDWKQLALHVFHVRTLAVYFGVMMVLQTLYLLGEPQPRLLVPLATSLVLSLTALAVLAWLAWMTARTALYTLTNKRMVMRIGIVLTLTFNLPLRMVAAASVKPLKNGSGDIALKLAGDDHIAWLNLWPHAKPWALTNP